MLLKQFTVNITEVTYMNKRCNMMLYKQNIPLKKCICIGNIHLISITLYFVIILLPTIINAKTIHRTKSMEKTMNNYVTVILTFLLMTTSFAQAGSADIPQLINYQGMLFNSDGQPMETNECNLSFSLFNQPTGGLLIWGPQIFDGRNEEGHGAKVPVVRGHFNVILGPKDTNSRVITDAFQTKNVYLQIKIDDNPAISPRQKILTVPYCVVSETVRGPDLYVNSDNGNVGIGLKTPKAPLSIQHSGTNDTPSIIINNPSPEIVLETESSHYNWRIAAQEDIDSSLEISSGNKDANASDDSGDDWKNLFVIKRENDIANVMIQGNLNVSSINVSTMNITEQPRCRVLLTKNKASSTQWKNLEWDQEDYDVGNCWNSDNKSHLEAPITGLYSLQGMVSTYNSDDNYAYINVYYLYEESKKSLGFWTHDRNIKDHTEWITISLQYYMNKGGCIVIEIIASENGVINGAIPGENNSSTFMTFAKIQ